ncbi:MmyB family transcriptional regulator [Leucobacter chromiiresistens]
MRAESGATDSFTSVPSASGTRIASACPPPSAIPSQNPASRCVPEALRELIGELSTASAEFSAFWASHDIRIRHDGIKRLQHPVVGECELTYQSMALPTPGRARHELSLYTAEPGTAHEERLALLASWRAPAATSRL